MHTSPRHVAGAAALLLVLLAVGCVRNPVTGELQLALISEAQEIEIGRLAARDVERSIGLVDDPALQEYVHSIGLRLAAASERPHLPWTFRVLDDPTPNAFALPGGPIYFTRGLMSLMSSEAQLAAVLGHEIGHITARHQVAMISRAQIAQLGLGLGGILFPDLERLGGLAGVGLDLLFLHYGRGAEREADELGFSYALADGYEMREMAHVFTALARTGDTHQRSSLPVWLSTHPAPAERAEAVAARVAALEPPPAPLRIGQTEYLQRIDGLAYGVDPRKGFFREAQFFHPELRFQMAFPTGWHYRNLAHTVMAVSPQQNAAVQLSLAADDLHTLAAARFVRRDGIRAAAPVRRTLHGLPALIVPFEASTGQGVLRGLAHFVQHGERVYQLFGYTTPMLYPGVERAFQQSLGSFAPLTDPQILAVQPDRLRVVRTEQEMTLAEFERRHPSTVPIAELAVLNQVEDAEAVLPAGSLVKRVAAD
jgi:predicted Zn-dependent protease